MASKYNDPAAMIAQAIADQKKEEARMQQYSSKSTAKTPSPADIIAQAQAEQAANQAMQNKIYAKPQTPVQTPSPADIIANAIAEQQKQEALMQQLYDPYRQQRINAYYDAYHAADAGKTGGGNTGTGAGYAPQAAASAGQSNAALSDKLAEILKNAYEKSLAANQTQYDNSVKAMQAAYASGETKVNEAAKAALREAYISQMQARRAMPQQLSALGINGGMAETTAARLNNSYADNRGQIEAGRLGELGALNDTLLQNMYAAGNQLAAQNAAVEQNYYQQLAEQAIANELPNIKVETVAYDYRTDPAFIAQYAGVVNGSTNKATVQANYEALVNKYGFNGAKALLAAAK